MYITCKPSVQFCTFPHSVYKGTKPTDFFVTAASQCNDENKKTNDNSNHKTNDNSNDKTNDNDDEDFKEEHECKVASQIGTQDLLDHPNFHPELRDSGMYNVINNMKKVNRGVITSPEHSSPFLRCLEAYKKKIVKNSLNSYLH